MGCTPITDTIILSVQFAPTADAGQNLIVCPGSYAFLNGNISNAPGAIWTTTGTGTFSPDNQTLSATYIPGTADSVAGSVDLILTALGSGLCSPVSDTMTINIIVPVIADFGNSPTCFNQATQFSDNTSVLSGGISGWYWSFGDGDTSNAQDPIHIYTSMTTYDVMLVVSSTEGCKDSVIKTVIINPVPSAGFTTIAEEYLIDYIIYHFPNSFLENWHVLYQYAL